MGAPNGKFWESRLLRRPRKIEEPQQFLDLAVEYFKDLDENGFTEIDFRGKDATKVELPKVRIPTKEDYALFCGFCEWKSIENYRAYSQEFSQIVTQVERAIQTAQIQYASAGFAKESIITRLTGLVDKQEIQQTGEINVNFVGEE